ncbi:hypothetical protein DFH27DRAFT_615479 [Peziza echinospora]|nr:hypothetical protein DFH27DRAFT_615479 [Peziza echinospora]
MAAATRRPLTLPEELEKLEQQITLTLQEIDHNFNKAHRIVTASIIPVVERFGTQSQAFWKQFFEASANVSLTKYEEEPTGYTEEEDETQQVGDETTGRNDTQYSEAPGEEASYLGEDSVTVEVQRRRDQVALQPSHGIDEDLDEDDEDGGLGDVTNDSLLASLNLDQSTPKVRKPQPGRWANVDSPYEKMKKGLNAAGSSSSGGAGAAAQKPSSKPQSRAYQSSDDDFSLGSSPEQPPTLRSNLTRGQQPPTTPRPGRGAAGGRRPQQPPSSAFPPESPFYKPHGDPDTLLHKILDKNWRIQATPRGKPTQSRYRNATTPRRPGLFGNNPSTTKTGTGTGTGKNILLLSDDDDDDFLSSPTIDSPAPPDLQTQIFDTPIQNRRRPFQNQQQQQQPPQSTSTTLSTRRLKASGPPRTPSRNHRNNNNTTTTTTTTSSYSTRAPPLPVPHPISSRKLRNLGDYHPHITEAPPAGGSRFGAHHTSSSAYRTAKTPNKYSISDDDDDDLLLSPPQFSPPVTIQFSLPQRTILATPAREASRRLVRDILRTAGADESANTSAEVSVGDVGGGGGGRGGPYGGRGYAGDLDEEEEEEEEEEYELDLGEYGAAGGGISSWRNQGAGGGGAAGGGAGGLENSPTIVRGRGMDSFGDETF